MLRNTFINALSLYFLTLIFSGVRVTGGITTYIIAGVFLSLMFNFLKPILNIVSLPLNLITMGTFSFLINVLIFYLATTLVGNISIKEFTYLGTSLAGFIIPKITLSTFFAYVAAGLLQSILVSFITWLRK